MLKGAVNSPVVDLAERIERFVVYFGAVECITMGQHRRQSTAH